MMLYRDREDNMEQTKYDVFISYSRKDYVDEHKNVIPGNVVSKIKEVFNKGDISYWFDEEGIYSGDEFASALTRAIRESKVFLFVSSVNSNQSKWTSNEISTAIEYKKTIIPFRIDESPYNDSVMMKIVSLDYIECKNQEKAINILLKAINHHLSAFPSTDKYLWRNVEVPKQARATTVGFVVNGELQKHVFAFDEERGKFKKIKTPENASIYKYIHDQKKLPEQQCWQLLHDVAEGLLYLHSQNPPIAHQEIAPGSILVNDDGHYTITDYDISSMSDIATDIHSRLHPNINIAYKAPECFTSQYRPILASDIWSLGAVMFHLMTGNLPFGQYGALQIEGAKVPEIDGDYSDKLKQLVYKCLERQPWERPKARDIIITSQYGHCPMCGYPTYTTTCPACGFNADSLEPPTMSSCLEPPQAMPPHQTTRPTCCGPLLRGECCSEPPMMPSPPKPSIRPTTQCIPLNSTRDPSESSSALRTVGKVLAAPFELIAAGVSATAKGIGKLAQKKEISYQPAKMKGKGDYVFSSVFAPAEVKRRNRLLIQVYLHLSNETKIVATLAQESQKDAKRRDYIPLQCKLKKEDKVDVLLNIYGETLLMSDSKSVIWHGSFTKCSFEYFIPADIDVEELSCVAILSVNGAQVGEMRFITKIVEQPRDLNPKVSAHQYKKIFISYAHQDEKKVKYLAEAYKAQGANYFFDRHYLKGGDVFPQVIQDYINSADLFILCWSENASKSEYVEKERTQALELAFPKVKPMEKATLSIYPMSIEPRAELPADMRDNYHFEEI